MTGPLAGTSAPSCNRWFIGGKSPLLNPEQFGLGNVGGSMTGVIKAAGLDGMIITGRTAKPSYIHIKDNKCEIKDANGLWGLGIPETLKRLTAAHGKHLWLAGKNSQAKPYLRRYTAPVNRRYG